MSERPTPIPSGTQVVINGTFETRILGATWVEHEQVWSYRLAHNRHWKEHNYHALSSEDIKVVGAQTGRLDVTKPNLAQV